MTHLITNFVSASPASYAIVFMVVAVDALLPFVQAEAVVITGAVLAAQGHLLIWLVSSRPRSAASSATTLPTCWAGSSVAESRTGS